MSRCDVLLNGPPFGKDKEYVRIREEMYRRICEASGVDESGCLIPPPAGATINRTENVWWKSRS